MSAPSVKEKVIHAIQRLPEDSDFRDINEEIALLAAVAEAEEDITEGRLVDNDTMGKRIASWTGSHG